MSDLVERVAKRTWEATTEGPHRDRAWGEIWRAPEVRRVYEQSARAAIAAVAEWLDEHHQIDKDGSVHCALTRQYTQKESK